MNRYDPQLTQVAEQTFEALAFMFPLGEDAPADVDADARQTAVVTFAGPLKGAMAISLGCEMLEPLAANMLGLEPPETPSAEQQRDALRELLNVICGNLLPLIGSPTDVYDVHAPQVLEGGAIPDTLEGCSPHGRADVLLDTGLAQIQLYLQD